MDILIGVCIILISVGLGNAQTCDADDQTANKCCIGKKHYYTIGLKAGAATPGVPQTWSDALNSCKALNPQFNFNLASVDAESERERFEEILDMHPGITFWTQGALVAQYGDGTIVDTDFKADDYPFINATNNPAWCLVLVKPIDSHSAFLRGADCYEANHYPLCQLDYDENCN